LINDGAAPEAPKFYEGTIIGVAPTIRQRSMQHADPDPIVYIPHRQDLLMGFYPLLIVRTRGNPAPVAALLRREVAALDSDIPLTNIRTMDENLARSRWSYRVFGTMFAIFAGIAVVLAAVGLYGVTSYSVVQRRQEIGIRMALGAQQRQVWWLVLRTGIAQLAAGLAVGLAGALAVGRLMESLLVQTEPADPVTLVCVGLLLVIVAVVACLWPARRAGRVDPLVALRYE
jgi:putative ABC transport system permease protein